MTESVKNLLNKYLSDSITAEEKTVLADMLSSAEYQRDIDIFIEQSFKNDAFLAEEDPKVYKAIKQYLEQKLQAEKTIVNISQRNSFFFRAWKYAAAAVIISFISGLSYFLFFRTNNTTVSHQDTVAGGISKNEMVTKKGSKSNITLPDGTEVTLNADSKITYGENFAKQIREVTLTGEAYFDVKHDEHHPFIIHAGNTNIKVLGTAFNVRNYEQEDFLETSLIRGKIEVTFINAPGNKIILKPSEKLVISKINGADSAASAHKATSPGLMSLTHVTVVDSVVSEISWIDNKTILIDKPLIEIMGELERQYNIKATFKSNTAKSYRYTIHLGNKSLNQVMEILNMSKGIQYKLENDELIIK